MFLVETNLRGYRQSLGGTQSEDGNNIAGRQQWDRGERKEFLEHSSGTPDLANEADCGLPDVFHKVLCQVEQATEDAYTGEI